MGQSMSGCMHKTKCIYHSKKVTIIYSLFSSIITSKPYPNHYMFLIESEAHCECLKLRMLLLRITVATMDDWGLNYMCIFNLYPLLESVI